MNTYTGLKRIVVPVFILILPPLSSGNAGELQPITVLKNVPYTYTVPDGIAEDVAGLPDTLVVTLNGSTIFAAVAGELPPGGITVNAAETGVHRLTVSYGRTKYTQSVRSIDGALSILPPIVAIAFALVFRQVVLALLAGIWLGSFFLSGFMPVAAILRIIDTYVTDTLAGPDEGMDHSSIIVFTLLLGGMVGITSRMGGMQGIVNRIARLATTPRRGQFAAWLMGVIIFFDDYTNTLIVGNSMRPLTDRLRISREKLSYIVDSTAAPVTSLAVITSWIGFQISLIDQSFNALNVERNPFTTFVASIPFSFYPILAVLFVLFIVLTRRDFSLMLDAERRARLTGKTSSDSAVPLSNIDASSVSTADGVTPRLINGVVPIAVVIIVTFVGLVQTGKAELLSSGSAERGLMAMIKESNSFTALLWGSFSGCIVAALLALVQRLLSLTEIVASWINGIRSMVTAIIILVLAWCIGKVCTELHTADYLVHNLSGVLTPRFLPAIVFLLAMGISFSTGTSWGTMSILTPIVIPLVYGTASSAGLSPVALEPVLLASIAAILSGAVFGDHCSPISDTTIMSSMASAADHIDHVRTQLPYAVTVGVISLVLGYLVTALGAPVAVALPVSIVALLVLLRFFGKSTETNGA